MVRADRAPKELVELLHEAAVAEPERALAALTELRGRLEALEARAVSGAVAAGTSWARIGGALGITRQAAHRRHSARIASKPAKPAGPELVITRRARQAVEYARAEARGLRSPDVRPEHLLLGLMRDRSGPAVGVLSDLGLTLPAAREALERAYATGAVERPQRAVAPPRDGRIPVSGEARRAFEQALREAVALGQVHLGVEHVLLALLRLEPSAAIATLAEAGVRPDAIEQRVRELDR